MRFKVDDLVVMKERIRPHTSYEIYKVVALLNGDYLLENYGSAWNGEIHPSDWVDERGSRSWHDALVRYQESELLTPEEYIAEQHKLEAEQSRLNAEFEEVHAQFKENLNKAADLINQSTSLAEACQKEIRDSLKRDYQSLFAALDKAGWSASFTRC